MHILIVTGGNIDKDIAFAMLKNNSYTYIIAVDKGLSFLDACGRMPDLIMGDFDSVDKDILHDYMGKNCRVKRFSSEKDATDTQLAVEEAIALGAAAITIIGGTGNRLDHTLSNIYILGLALRHNISCRLIDAHNVIQLIDKTTYIQKNNISGNYISLLPYTESVENITLKGFRYPLQEYTLHKDTSIGISNELTEDSGMIAFTKGILIMIQARD